MKEETKVFVIYIGIAFVRDVDIPDFIERVKENLIPSNVEGEFIIIPVQSTDTRIECINPTYITDDKLIRKHRLLMDELHEHINYYIDEQKENKNRN
jgi:hypothetical protein